MGPEVIGKVVHFRIGGTDEAPVLRTGHVIHPGNGKRLALRLDLDPSIDGKLFLGSLRSALGVTDAHIAQGVAFVTGVHADAVVTGKPQPLGTWRWPAGW